MPQESIYVSLTVLAPVFQQAMVCDTVFFFLGDFQSKSTLQGVLERICIFTMLYWCFFVLLFLCNGTHRF